MTKNLIRFLNNGSSIKKTIKILLLLIVFFLFTISVSAERDYSKEEKIGRKVAAKVDKQYELIEDEEILQKIQEIGEQLKEVSGIEEINYQFKIIKRDGPNAFAFPGGFIYLTADLLDYVHSDDELAAVIAHEMGHVIHQHSIKQLQDKQKLKLVELLAVLVTGDPTVGILGELTSITILNAYRREYEEEADLTALELLLKSNYYHPIALLTYFERVKSEQILKPEIKLGIFQTHPDVEERIKKIKEFLFDNNLPLNRRLTTNYLTIRGECQREEQEIIAQIWLNDEPILSFIGNDEEMLRIKMNNIVSNFDQALRLDLEAYEIGINSSEPEKYASLSIGSEMMVSLSPQEVQFQRLTPSEVLKVTRDKIAGILWKVKLELPILLTKP
ncbi:MAG TPA: M48 family metalloprotease [Atribacterota bacterium]|nr:M48 family metalloprotease [Atribacterota bacterium]